MTTDPVEGIKPIFVLLNSMFFSRNRRTGESEYYMKSGTMLQSEGLTDTGTSENLHVSTLIDVGYGGYFQTDPGCHIDNLFVETCYLRPLPTDEVLDLQNRARLGSTTQQKYAAEYTVCLQIH